MDNTDSPGALVRCHMWFGLEKDAANFCYPDTEGRIGVYAETYQNVVNKKKLHWYIHVPTFSSNNTL